MTRERSNGKRSRQQEFCLENLRSENVSLELDKRKVLLRAILVTGTLSPWKSFPTRMQERNQHYNQIPGLDTDLSPGAAQCKRLCPSSTHSNPIEINGPTLIMSISLSLL